jgi:hypothetical protein
VVKFDMPHTPPTLPPGSVRIVAPPAPKLPPHVEHEIPHHEPPNPARPPGKG